MVLSRRKSVTGTSHVTQRGNYKQNIFGEDKDRIIYLKLIQEYSQKYEEDEDDLNQIRKVTLRNSVFGPIEFIQELEQKLQIKILARPCGRPRNKN